MNAASAESRSFVPTARGHWIRPAGNGFPVTLPRWGEGFCVNHLMVPWLNYDDILERQRSYDLIRFKNEVLGLPSTTGDQVVTRAELEACCSDLPMAQSLDEISPAGQGQLVAGIDWGGGGTSRTVLVIGWMRSDYRFQVCRLERFDSQDDPTYVLEQLAQRCQQFQVRYIAADGGGNGNVQNRLLVEKLGAYPNIYGIFYSVSDHEPQRHGLLTKWTVESHGHDRDPVHAHQTADDLFSTDGRLRQFPRRVRLRNRGIRRH